MPPHMSTRASTCKLPVRERGDDKPIRTSEKFVLIDGVDVADSDNTSVVIFTEVEPCLLQPFEVLRRPDLHPHLNTKYARITYGNSQPIDLPTSDFVTRFLDFHSAENANITKYCSVIMLLKLHPNYLFPAPTARNICR